MKGISGTTKIRVRYGETDQMGIVNNAVYPSYFEVGRTELFRHLGLPYGEIEKQGIMLPLSELRVKYHRPAFYDEDLTIETSVKEWPGAKIRFEYRIFNEKETLLVTGETILAYVKSDTRRPTKIPQFIESIIAPFFT
jgi:acyl-CoA thioester hydrolase